MKALNCVAGVAAVMLAIWTGVGEASAACRPGAYGPGDGDFVAIVAPADARGTAFRYLFRDGRRGGLDDPDSPIRCDDAGVSIVADAVRWPRLALRETDTHFTSAATRLHGVLIEPEVRADPRRPLVVLVHGSEKTPATTDLPARYALAAQGIAVFVYDKRGTGGSDGEYTQNFELLADDAAAALTHAQSLAAGRYGKSGFYGGSQGAWIAPLASTRSAADFVAVGFGLVVSPIEEDREQMQLEARKLRLDRAATEAIDELSRFTGRLVSTHFAEGFAELEAFRRKVAGQPWVAQINGEHSGAMLRMSDAELRRVGRARFDNLELIWNYDSVAALRAVRVPMLWVLAGEDREAPIEGTLKALNSLGCTARPIDLYVFPETDHGIREFVTLPDGERRMTKIAEGYLRLLGDWIKDDASGRYGRAQRIALARSLTGGRSRR